jgi:hypothetical protein
MFLRVPNSVREWTHTFPSEFPFWELKSQWIPESSEGDYKGKNPLDWRIIDIIGNLLKHRCLKWAHMTHLDIKKAEIMAKRKAESQIANLTPDH